MSAATRCRSCRAEVRWVRTAEGKDMPIDPAPVDGGNVVLTQTRNGYPVATVMAPGQLSLIDEGPRYVAHFATCPQAALWRKR